MPSNTLSKANDFFSSVSGVDKAYKIIVYLCKILAFKLTATNGDRSEIVQRIQSLARPLSDTRMVLRFFGLLSIIDSLRQKSIQKDLVLRQVEKLKLYSMLVYYPCEHLYWLASHKVINLSNADAWSRWSCRAWAVYIALDLYTVFYELSPVLEKIKEMRTLSGDKKKAALKEIKTLAVERDNLFLRTIMNSADLPLAVHWSLASYPLNEFQVGVLGLVSGLVSFYLKWKNTV